MKETVGKPISINNCVTKYDVSDTGYVRNRETGTILKPGYRGKPKNPYQFVILYLNGIATHHSVHRLVAEAFIPNPDDKPQVNHIDGDRFNNAAINLEWVTAQENITHAFKLGLIPIPGKGAKSRNAKYDEALVHKACRLLEKGISVPKIAKKLGTTEAFIQGIKYGNWEDVRSLYSIPGSKRYERRDPNKIDAIKRLLLSGVSNKRDILEQVGLPDNPSNRQYIKNLRAAMVRSSTTIKKSDPIIEECFRFLWER